MYLSTAAVAVGLLLGSMAYSDFQAQGLATIYVDRLAITQIRTLQTLIADHELTVEDTQNLIKTGTVAIEFPTLNNSTFKDPWARDYNICLSEQGQIEIYSFGSDGLSQTNGNDPDDISSWSGAGPSYMRARWWAFATRAASYTIGVAFIVGAISWGAVPRRANRAIHRSSVGGSILHNDFTDGSR